MLRRENMVVISLKNLLGCKLACEPVLELVLKNKSNLLRIKAWILSSLLLCPCLFFSPHYNAPFFYITLQLSPYIVDLLLLFFTLLYPNLNLQPPKSFQFMLLSPLYLSLSLSLPLLRNYHLPFLTIYFYSSILWQN